MNKYRIEYCEENGFTKINPENTEIKGYVKYLENKLNEAEAKIKLLDLHFVSVPKGTVCPKCGSSDYDEDSNVKRCIDCYEIF